MRCAHGLWAAGCRARCQDRVHVLCRLGGVADPLGVALGCLPQDGGRQTDSLVLDRELADHCAVPVGHCCDDHDAHPASRLPAVQREPHRRGDSGGVRMETGPRGRVPAAEPAHAALDFCWLWRADLCDDSCHALLCHAWVPLACQPRRHHHGHGRALCALGGVRGLRRRTRLQDVGRSVVEDSDDGHKLGDARPHHGHFPRAQLLHDGRALVGCCAVRHSVWSVRNVARHRHAAGVPRRVLRVQESSDCAAQQHARQPNPAPDPAAAVVPGAPAFVPHRGHSAVRRHFHRVVLHALLDLAQHVLRTFRVPVHRLCDPDHHLRRDLNRARLLLALRRELAVALARVPFVRRIRLLRRALCDVLLLDEDARALLCLGPSLLRLHLCAGLLPVPAHRRRGLCRHDRVRPGHFRLNQG
eukprot:Amastigsp_a53_1498.p2 type:complete len:415 gc:universal Amastigsp_a53_1498:671-1915(+)